MKKMFPSAIAVLFLMVAGSVSAQYIPPNDLPSDIQLISGPEIQVSPQQIPVAPSEEEVALLVSNSPVEIVPHCPEPDPRPKRFDIPRPKIAMYGSVPDQWEPTANPEPRPADPDQLEDEARFDGDLDLALRIVIIVEV